MKCGEEHSGLELLRSPDAEQLLAYLAEHGEHKALEVLKRYFPNSTHLERIKGPTCEEYRAAKNDYLISTRKPAGRCGENLPGHGALRSGKQYFRRTELLFSVCTML